MIVGRHRVRMSSTDSVTSVNRDNTVDVELQQTTKLLPYTDIRETLDQYEVFENERNSCNQYRLIVTIRPYCTNVLFNVLTEIIKNEGASEDITVVTDSGTYTINDSDVMGKTANVDRNHMVMDTEYSKESIGYEYHPGFDIFTNHILRNTTFKLVNKSGSVSSVKDKWVDFDNESSTPTNTQAFNTLGDFMRDKDGTVIQYRKRTSLDKQKTELTIDLNKHLYLSEDLLSVENGDSVNANLTEDNGWFGFMNNSTISAKKRQSASSSEWEDMDISRVLNNRRSCEFVDMYPDRTLYSFNPKYNMFKHRAENNWNLCITYPYRNDKNHPIISNLSDGDGRTNALKILSIRKIDGLTDNTILMVRTYSKHGLSAGDSLYFYYSIDGGATYTRTESTYKVANTGDLENDNKEYFFYMTDLTLIREALGDEYWYDDTSGKFKKSDDDVNAAFVNHDFRMTHVVNGVESEYYMRIFRKLPNLRAKKEILTEDIANDEDLFEQYIKDNASEDGVMYDFNREQYQLAFSSTIYNDNCSQVTFTDSLDVSYITDNLGRPLTELFITIVKNNAGYKAWYSNGSTDYTSDSIEYSHCFGKLTSGMLYKSVDGDETTTHLNLCGNFSHVGVINNLDLFDSKSMEEYVTVDCVTSKEISYKDNEFIGDLVEFIPCQVQEVVLEDIYHRFNTAQREVVDIANESSRKYYKFQYQEITADDYDLDDFTVTNYTLTDVVNRPEGYYYKAHYQFPIRNFGSIQQGAHYEMKIKSATPVQMNGIYVRLASTLEHGLSVNDVVYICDDALDKWYTTTVVYVEDTLTFIINKLDEMNWIKLCDILNNEDENKQFVVRRKNTDIPSYAVRVGTNKFLWRDVVRVGDMESTIPEYVFANNHFYVTKEIDFFLKRQDPLGKNGLYNYAKDYFPNDIAGNKVDETTYTYSDLDEVIC